MSQPWGEYMARAEHTYSPFVFADTLIRAGLKLAALDVEWVMGVTPRGSYCRDLLDASRVLDLYAMLGTPLQVSLAYPVGGGAGPAGRPGARGRRPATGGAALRPPRRPTGRPTSPAWPFASRS